MEFVQRRWSSVSRHIIIGVSLELVVVSVLLSWWAGLSVWASLVLAIALIFLVRILLALFSFALAWWFRSEHGDAQSLTVTAWSKLVLLEIAAFLKLFFIFHPFEPLLNKHDEHPSSDSEEGAPILFVHGFFSNAGFWLPLKRYLRSQSVRALFTINLDPVFNDIDAYAEQLAARIAQVCALVGQQKLVLIGHSMGGLVCRAYLDKHGGKHVHKIISLGSPHYGTLVAYLLRGRNLTQMRPGNEWLLRLNAKKTTVPITTHYSVHDNIVVPQDNARLAGAKEYLSIGLGHLSMAFSSEMMRSVLEEIRTSDQKT